MPRTRKITLDNPLDGHDPIIDRIQTGSTWGGGRCYATTFRCSCGYIPEEAEYSMKYHHRPKITNVAPSKGGRSMANEIYQRHIAELVEQANADEEALATISAFANPRAYLP